MFLLSPAQAEEWQKEGIEYLTKKECEWVTVEIEENEITIFDRLPVNEGELQLMGAEILELKNQAQFILMEVEPIV